VWYGNEVKIQTLEDVEQALKPYFEVARHTTGQGITVERQKRLMHHLGNPERGLRIVHVAGTSGKTSTCYYIATLLQKTGAKVGLTVSPHVDSLAERVQISGFPLEEAVFCDYFAKYLELLQTAPETPSWFECMVGFAYWVFAREKVDYAVIETGLGGLHDGTNVAERTDKLCAITDIGYDHMHVLGNRLGAIAHQKAGIIHEGNTTLMYEQSDEVMQVVRYWVSQQEGAELLTFTQEALQRVYGHEFAAYLPLYQQRNWLLAYAAYKFLARRDKLIEIPLAALLETQKAVIPGRMDRVVAQGKTIVMDGAHNGQKMAAFVASFASEYGDTKVPVLLALKEGKEVEDVAPELAKIASKIIVTTFSRMQDLPFASKQPSEIVRSIIANGVKCEIIEDPAEAYAALIEATDTVGVITGSFFLIGQLRSKHGGLR
jgi:dihydrofolate synthase/folylpolyglutamate synthase